MNSLFDSLTLRSVTFKNRVWVSPMCQYSATDGFVGEWHQVHLGSFATGGVGMIMVEATGVVPEGRISIGCPSIEDTEHAEAFRPMIDFAHSHGVKMGIQLAHAGRKASTMRPGSDHLMASASEGGWQASHLHQSHSTDIRNPANLPILRSNFSFVTLLLRLCALLKSALMSLKFTQLMAICSISSTHR